MEPIPKAIKSRLTILVMSVIILAGAQIRSQPVTIDLIKGCETKGSIKLSEIADHISYVKLETTKDCLIGAHANKLYFYKNNWFIQQGRFLRFDSNGKFLNAISGRGKGPGEFIELSGAGFNAKNDHLYVINRLTDQAMEFSLDGRLVGNIRNVSVKSIPLNNQYFVNSFPVNGLFLSDGYRITIVSLDGKIQKKLLKQDLAKMNAYIPIIASQLKVYQDSVTCWDAISDTIYRIGSDLNLTPRFILNFGKEAVPFYLRVPNNGPDVIPELEKYSHVMSFIESEKFLFFEVDRKGKFLGLLYDKSNGRCFSMDFGGKSIVNDLDPDFLFWPQGITDDGRLFMIADVADLKVRFAGSPANGNSSAETGKTLRKIVGNSKDDDNPILILLTPKK